MSSPVRRDTRRYRRRILAICAAIATIGFVVTAPIYLERVESDLETRVPDELADAGYPNLTASFSGQDGTIFCEAPLTDPEAARQAAYDIWGVRAIELDRTCRVNTTPDPEDSDESADAAATTATATDPTTPTTTTPTSTTSPSEPAFATVADAVAGSPQLSLLAVLLQEADLIAEFGDPGADPVTLFAASDDAFEALPADVLAEIREDTELLRSLVLHHTANGALPSDDFATGPIDMADGTTLELDADVPSIDGATISVVDVETGNGVVHVVDDVIFPEDFGVGAAAMAEAGAAFDGTTLGLTGTVATEVVRSTLLGAATDGVDVIDELGVDPDTGVDAEVGARMASLISSTTSQLLEASVAFDGEALAVTGVASSEAARDVVAEVAAEADATAEITVEAAPEPEPDPDPAADVEALLNAFVAANPILFQPSSALITADSAPALDRIAAIIGNADGVVVTVEGHTDSDGDPDENLTLSRLRALSVERALIERGIADDVIEFEGFGSSQPILVDGVEDKAASRRVEFRVVTVSP